MGQISPADYLKHDATGLASLIEAGEVGACEVLEAAIRRAEELNPRLNAIVAKHYDGARERATGPIAPGPFRGVPFLVKDLGIDLAGTATTGGSRFLRDAVADRNSALADRYLEASVDDVIVTKQVDGLPQRVLQNELVRKLEASSAPGLLLRALRSGLAYRKLSGASFSSLLRSGLALRRHEKLTRAQTLMAANAPVLARKAMLEGDPVAGYLPSGSVAGVIEDRPSCAELIERIVREAEQTLEALAK